MSKKKKFNKIFTYINENNNIFFMYYFNFIINKS